MQAWWSHKDKDNKDQTFNDKDKYLKVVLNDKDEH